MIQSQNNPSQITTDVLQLLGDFVSAKQKYSMLKSWINLKNYAL